MWNMHFDTTKYIKYMVSFYKNYLRITSFVAPILILLVTNAIPVLGAPVNSTLNVSTTNPPIELKDAWKHRWGDSPLDQSGTPLWTIDGKTGEDWVPIKHHEGPQNTKGLKHMWLQISLPANEWKNPAILYRTVEQSIEVYLEDRLIYTYGKINFSNPMESLGSPWHVIPLPDGYQGKTLYIRVYSNSIIFTGSLRAVFIGSTHDLLITKSNLIIHAIKRDIDYIILSGLFLFLGLGMIYLYLIKGRAQPASLSLGFASVCLGLWLFAESTISTLFIDSPILWVYIAYLSIHLVSIGFSAFANQVFGDLNKTILPHLWKFYAIYIPVALILDITNTISFMYSIKFYHITILIAFIIAVYPIIKSALKGDRNAKIFTFGFIILCISSIFDVIDKFYVRIIFYNGHHLIQWAMFIFMLAQVYIMDRHYIEIQDKLHLYSMEIKAKDETILESKRLLDDALEYDKLKNEFIANISHELRTPLSIILGTLQLFKIYINNGVIIDSNENIKGYIKSMQQNCYRLLRLVNNVIDITKIDSGHLQPSFENCNIIAIAKDITHSVSDYIKSKGIKVQFTSNVSEKVLACDPEKIERILLNLLSNAVKFTRPGGMIHVDVLDKNIMVEISVSDTGIGIPEDKLDIVFERFRQVDKTMTRSHEGSGIGLSIVQSLVSMHSGSVSVDSKPGKGSKFMVTLPVRILEEDTPKPTVSTLYPNHCVEKIDIEFSDIYS